MEKKVEIRCFHGDINAIDWDIEGSYSTYSYWLLTIVWKVSYVMRSARGLLNAGSVKGAYLDLNRSVNRGFHNSPPIRPRFADLFRKTAGSRRRIRKSFMYRIGIDVGGTFTDFTLVNETDKKVSFHKVPSTPHDPSEAIGQGIADLLEMHRITPSEVGHIGHGTTVATNLVIERKGAATGLITTRGFRDVLEIGRQVRPHLYDYGVGKPPALVPRRHRIEVGERIDAHGKVQIPLDEDAVRVAAEAFRDADLEAVTICFLHSYRNPSHERRAREIVREVLPNVYLSLSSDVLPEFREYERLSTTVLNATVGPKMARYLDRFVTRIDELGISDEPFTIHSNGGLMSIETVRNYPVRTCLSGPAAGVVGAAAVGRAIGFPNLVTFDVGGTSTDVSLVRGGEPLFTSSRQVAGYPVRTPMVDIHVIGAGGGSIAWRDDAGSLKVGPHSAGAVPGPVAYSRGGVEPTITDAEVALQRLNPVTLLNGRMKVDREGACRVLTEKVAKPLGLTLEEAAEGILRIANANMSRAIRSVSTERGYALSEFALYAYGGAGPLHALDVAEECGIPVVIVPQEPGTMCARGILLTDLSFDFVRSQIELISEQIWGRVVECFQVLEQEAGTWFDRERVSADRQEMQRVVDARYIGQNFEVQVSMDTISAADFDTFVERFAAAHLREYGYNVPGRAIEVINCRLKAVGQVAKAPLARAAASPAEAVPIGSRDVFHGAAHGWIDTPVFERVRLGAGATIEGPAVIEEMSSTTVIGPAHRLIVDDFGNLIIRLS
jgi:N-methylhydantoinase A